MMRLPHRLSAFILLTILVFGCGKKPGPDGVPAPAANPTGSPTPVSAPPPAASPGITGTYLIVGAEVWGEKIPKDEIDKDSELERTVKINKDHIQASLFIKRDTIRYKLDPTRSPAEIDLLSDETGKKPNATYGIYKVEGDTLTLFIWGAPEPHQRPREFKTLGMAKRDKSDQDADRQAGGTMILILKKVSDDTTFSAEPPPKTKPPGSR